MSWKPRKTMADHVSRFMSKVDQQTNGCWLWTGHADRDGYALFAFPRYPENNARTRWNNVKGSRFAYEMILKKKLQQELVIDHLCRNPRCVNPDHLEAVPQKINALRGVGPSAVNAAKKTCIYGHVLTVGINYRNGKRIPCRVCKTCRSETEKRWRDKNREKRNARRRKARTP